MVVIYHSKGGYSLVQEKCERFCQRPVTAGGGLVLIVRRRDLENLLDGDNVVGTNFEIAQVLGVELFKDWETPGIVP